MMLKILQARLQHFVNHAWTSRCSSWIYKRQRKQRSNSQHPLDHRKSKSSRKMSTSALLTTPKSLTVFISVTQVSWLCNPTDCSRPGLPVYHQLPEFTQIHVHWVGDATQPSHPLSSPSPTFNLSQHQGLFWWVSSSYQLAKVLQLQLQHQSFQWVFRTDLL